nr:MAG TPA_asm: hypothetical protein [Caudoviricetes sp.]
MFFVILQGGSACQCLSPKAQHKKSRAVTCPAKFFHFFANCS